MHRQRDATKDQRGGAPGRLRLGPHGLEPSAVADAVVAGDAAFGANDYKKVIDAMRAVPSHSLPEASRLVTALPARRCDRGGPGRPPAGPPDSRIQIPDDSDGS